MKDPKAVRAFILANVSLADLLVNYGSSLPQRLQPQQLSCPFHGRDLSMSARYYPDTNSMYCFACKEAWDPISFVMKTNGLKFMDAARHLASKQGLDLSKVADLLGGGRLMNFKGSAKGIPSAVDKRKMALYLLEEGLRSCKEIEEPAVFSTMLYVLSCARHIEDQSKFAEVTLPVARRIHATLG